MAVEFLKWVHVLSATLLFGTGLGGAFYKWRADRSANIQAIAQTNRTVVIADWLFTTPTVIIQPLSGIWLANLMDYSLNQSWIVAALVFYFFAGACWLPVVWLQIRMRNLSQQAVAQNTPLDTTYHRFARYWFWLGVPAFISMVVVFFLMVFKPVFS